MAGGLPLVNKTPSSILRAEVIAWTIPTFSAMSKTVVEGKRPKPTMRIPDNFSFVVDTSATLTKDRDTKNRKGQPLSSNFQQIIRPTAENLGPLLLRCRRVGRCEPSPPPIHHLLRRAIQLPRGFFAPSTVCVQQTTTWHDAVSEQRMRKCVEDSTLMYETLACGSNCLGWSIGGMSEEWLPADCIYKSTAGGTYSTGGL